MTQSSDTIFELRRYRLHPGMRETLIELFDHEFIEAQEALSMQVIGQFRDLDDPDSFVWLRGFRDMAARARALRAFYTGPVWAAHRDRANSTMINSDNVLLLRTAAPGGGFGKLAKPRPGPGSTAAPPGLCVTTICSLAPRTEASFAEFFGQSVRPLLEATGARIDATLVTEHSPNTFPRLPVREGETVFLWLMSFRDAAAYDAHLAALDRLPGWRQEVLPGMDSRVWRRNEVARLAPTARSGLHW